MGDRRFGEPLARLKAAARGADAVRLLSYEEVVLALGAASREGDAYLANVLTSELLNRSRRGTAVVFSLALGVAAAIVFIVFAAAWLSQHPHNFDDHVFLLVAFVALAAGALGALAAHAPILSRLRDRRV